MKRSLQIIMLLLFCFQIRSLHAQDVNNSNGGNSNIVYINVDKPDASNSDTFMLFRYKKVLSDGINRFLPHDTFYAVMSTDKMFHFEIPHVNNTDYIRIRCEKFVRTHQLVDILSYYMTVPGDSVTVHIAWDSSYQEEDHLVHRRLPDGKVRDIPLIQNSPRFKYFLQYHLSFSGRGAVKYQCNRALDSLRISALGSRDAELKTLASFRADIDAKFYNIFKADIIGNYEWELYHSNLHSRKGSSSWNVARDYFDSVSDNPDIPVKAKILSRYYTKGLLVRSYAGNLPRKRHYTEIYNEVVGMYKGELRDKVLAILAKEEYIPDSTGILQNAKNIVIGPFYKRIILQVIKGQGEGRPAYDFSLPDSSGRMVSLSDFKGKVVFIDFWFTGCGACKAFYQKQLVKVEREFSENEDVVFISISIDRARKMWLHSIRSGVYSSDKYAVNLYTDGDSDKHPVISNFHIYGYPQTFIIDKQGRFVTYAVREASEIIKRINKLLEKS